MTLNGCFSCLQFQRDEVIASLDFSNIVLSNTFPDIWQYERTLEELQLSSTRINNLPPQLFYCQGLRVLIVNNNSLGSIPNAIGSLRLLETLNLSRNVISNVPDSIQTCKNLTHLDLSYNNLQRLPDALTRLLSLQELLLNETYLEFLPANFGRLVNLRILELRLNNLIALPKSMIRLCNLHRLDIGGNEFSELPEVIGELKQLRELWIDFNQIYRISTNVTKLQDLSHFEASGNLINFLPNDLCNWRNIEVLSVCTNNLETLPFSVGMLRSLVTLKCEMNGLHELPDSISNLENLEELVLSHNKLVRLPTTIGMLRKLAYLFVDDNELRCLPDEICSCSNLCLLSVNRNKISELPKNIGRLNKLKVLNLVKNYICTLPVSILSLVNLSSLWITDNQSQPLVPLQYADSNTKTELTCFMLPQTGQRQMVNIKNKRMHTNQQLICNDQRIEEERIYGSFSDMNSCTSPIRRTICFAEKATIMSDTSKSKYDVSVLTLEADAKFLSERDKITIAPANCDTRDTYLYDYLKVISTDNSSEVPEVGARLMRSPTPYPKEWRVMAKDIQNNQKQIYTEKGCSELRKRQAPMLNYINNNKNSCHNLPSDLNTLNGSEKHIQAHFKEVVVLPDTSVLEKLNICSKETMDKRLYTTSKDTALQYAETQRSMLQQYKPAVTRRQEDLDQNNVSLHVKECQNFYTTYLVMPNQINSFYFKKFESNHHDLNQFPQQSQNLAQQHDLPNTYFKSGSSNSLFGVLQSPPYHKKRAEDSSNYETIRYQQQSEHNHNNSVKAVKPLTAVTWTSEDDIILNEIVESKRNSQVVNGCDTQFELNKSEQRRQSHGQAVHGSGVGDIEGKSPHQESIIVSPSQLSVPSDISMSTVSIADNFTSTVNSYNLASKTIGSNNSFKQKINKTTPWLFGMHKNPTVIQITLKVEHRVGFDISELPNKEGIFVNFIVPNTAAARMLCIKDKLLEVDGHDFTNIRLEDAKIIILSAGAVMNIMLSRK